MSGEEKKMEAFTAKLQEMKVRFVPLKVGGSFHTPYMKEASKKLKEEINLAGVYNVKESVRPIYSNKTSKPYPNEQGDIVDLLSEQISNSVKWEETLLNMSKDGVDTFIECGPGKTLSGFVKRTLPNVKIYNVNDMESLNTVIHELNMVV